MQFGTGVALQSGQKTIGCVCVCVGGECLSVCVDKFLELVTVLVFVACGLWFELVVML